MHCRMCRDQMLALTRHDWKFLEPLAQGMTNIEIAQALGLTEKTVKNALSVIYMKFGLLDRLKVVVFLYQHRLIPLCEAPPNDPYGRAAKAERATEKIAASVQ